MSLGSLNVAAQTTGAESPIPLSAFILRAGLLPTSVLADDAGVTYHLWSDTRLSPIDRAEDELLAASTSGDVIVALLDRPRALAPWQAFVRDAFRIPGFGVSGRSLGAVVFCACADRDSEPAWRWVAFTFGSASYAVRKRSVEQRFGLIVALNRLARAGATDAKVKGRVKQAAFCARGPYTYQAGVRAARDTPLESLPINRLADVLSGAGGRAGRAAEGDVYGSRSFRYRAVVLAPEDLVDLGNEMLVDYRDTAYRQDFGFIDQIVPVVDEEAEGRLRSELVAAIKRSDERVDVLLPDDHVPLEDERSICYVVLPGERVSRASDMVLTLSMVERMVRRGGESALDAELRLQHRTLFRELGYRITTRSNYTKRWVKI